MIRAGVLLNYTGKIVMIIGLAMFTSVFWAFYYNEPVLWIILASSLFTVGAGFIFSFFNRQNKDMNYREGFAVVTLGWIAASLFGAIPYQFSGYFPSLADAIFETISGFTTTGASILTNVEALPMSLLWWRSLTHWLGGMGIIALFVAIMAGMGVRANQIFRAEIPGPASDKISPRIRETAQKLWITYVVLSLVLVVLLYILGMNLFDSLCHSFATMATGGFSTKNQSIAYFTSPYIQWTLTIFMFIAGASFSLHYLSYKSRNIKPYIRNKEFLLYTIIVLLAGCLAVFGVGEFAGTEERFRIAFFNVVSVITTTGFASADFDKWAPIGKAVLFFLMFIGGCAGSTSGGIKVGRHLIMMQRARIELGKFTHPRALIPQQYGGRIIEDALIINVLQFFFLYIMLVLVGTVIMTTMSLDLASALTAVLACLGNIGPGFGQVGPVNNYAFIPDTGKYVLSFLMLLGRLEIYPVMLLFFPLFWRK